MEKRGVGGRTQSSTRGCFSSFYLDWDWDPISALGTAPVKTHRNTHAHTPPGQVERAKDAWIAQKPSRGSSPAVWNSGLREEITHWLQRAHTQMRTLTRAHTDTIRVRCSKLRLRARSQMHTNTHVLSQMCYSGLGEGITQTNKEQGKGSWESLERQQSHFGIARWWGVKGQEDGNETERRKKCTITRSEPRFE